jgi:hypothetical protein
MIGSRFLKRMKLPAAIFFSLIIGFGVGWFSFRTKEMAEFRDMIQKTGLTSEQWIAASKAVPSLLENIEADDRMAAVISLSALSSLESGKIEETKQFLARRSASYFVIYGPPDNPRKKLTDQRKATLEAIEKVRQKSPLLDAAITTSRENIEK